MKNNPKNVSTPIIVILYLLAVLFLGYGIYMAYDAVVYVNTYDTNNAVSSSNMLQYVIAASASYFGFAITIFAAAAIMSALNKVQRNLYHALSGSITSEDASEEIIEKDRIPAVAEASADPVENSVSDTTAQQPVQAEASDTRESIDTDEAADESTDKIADEALEAVEEIQSAEDITEDELVEKAETAEETQPAENPEIIPEQQDTVSETQKEASEETPLAAELSSQFLSGSEEKPAPEIVVQQQPTPEIVIQKTPAAKLQPEAVAEKPDAKPQPEIIVEKTDAKLQPTSIPEEILQTKRKRGLKYETVSMDMEHPSPEISQNLTDTIRLKKEDREAISSSFIKNILEKNE